MIFRARRIISLLLILMLMFSLSAAALAENDTEKKSEDTTEATEGTNDGTAEKENASNDGQETPTSPAPSTEPEEDKTEPTTDADTESGDKTENGDNESQTPESGNSESKDDKGSDSEIQEDDGTKDNTVKQDAVDEETTEEKSAFDATVELTGGRCYGIQDDEFTFTVTVKKDDEDESEAETVEERVVSTGSCREDGSIIFTDLALKPEDIGEELVCIVAQNVVEQTESGVGVKCDDSTFEITVKVTADETTGNPVAEIVLPEKGIKFTNEYQAKTYLNISDYFLTSKVLKGGRKKVIQDNEFKFQVKDSASKVVGTGATLEEGEISFKDIKFTQKNIGKKYKLTITEVKGTDSHIKYSEEEYYLTFRVLDNGDGTLEFSEMVLTKANKEVDELTFTNTYSASKLPQSGARWWIVYAFALSGVLFIAVPMLRKPEV